MIRLHQLATTRLPCRINTKALLLAGMVSIIGVVSTGCTTNYLTNSTEGTYGVPFAERTIPQRLLDRSIEHTAKINVYGLQENLQQNSRMSINSFNSEVLLSGEVPTAALKTQIEQVVKSMPDVRRVYNELNVSAARGYSSTVQDGYITSKFVAKAIANNGVKKSQIKTITDNGVVYLLGRVTPTQQSHLIDIANNTAGITELVLLTTVLDNSGAPISDEDIMSEASATSAATSQAPVVTPVVRSAAPADSLNNTAPVASPIVENSTPKTQSVPAAQSSSSPYIDLYQQP